jgi:hypothetical protein
MPKLRARSGGLAKLIKLLPWPNGKALRADPETFSATDRWRAMAQHSDFLSASLDDMIEIAAMAWRSSPPEGVHLLHKFQDVRDTLLLFAQAGGHPASLRKYTLATPFSDQFRPVSGVFGP